VAGLLLVLALAGGALVVPDVRTPDEVPWEPVVLQGVAALRADGLVLQHQRVGEVWASEGFSLYRSRDGGPFRKVFAVRPRIGEAWAGYSRTLRERFGYQELVELVPVAEDRLVVFAGGDVYRVDLAQGVQQRVHRLRYFGRGEGRGVMAHGLAIDDRGAVYYGEYTTRPSREGEDVRIWRSEDEGRTWTTAFAFPPGAARHVHNVQFDPVGGGIWVGTGDTDDRSRLGVSHDGGRTFSWVGEGSQRFRVCSVLFLRDAVAWAMDADREPVHAVRRGRADGALVVEPRALPGPGYFAQAIDDRHGVIGLAELDASLWLLPPEGDAVPLLAWTLPSPPRPGPHPGVRLARGDLRGDPHLHVNPLRTTEDRAAIYRVAVSDLLARAAVAATSAH
jgi:hypothetical protein